MTATLELFGQFKRCLGVHTDSDGAAALGVKSQTVSNWRTRGSQAEPRLVEAMCNTVGADLAEWLLRVQAEQATSQPNKTVWQKAIKQLGYTLGSLGVLIGVHVLEPGGSDMEAGGGEAFASLLATMMDAANFSLYL